MPARPTPRLPLHRPRIALRSRWSRAAGRSCYGHISWSQERTDRSPDGKEAKRNTGRSSSNSALLDQLAKSRAALVEREFQNDSEDDERVYART